MQKYRVSILTVTIALALALRWSKPDYLLLAPILPGIIVTWLFVDLSLRARVILWLSVVGGVALARTCGSMLLYKDDWRFDGVDVLGTIVFLLICSAVISILIWLVVQRKKPGSRSSKVIKFLRNVSLFSKVLMVMHALIVSLLFSVLICNRDSGYYELVGVVMFLNFLDFPIFIILGWIISLGPDLQIMTIFSETVLYLSLYVYVLIFGTIQWYTIGWLGSWLLQKFYGRPDTVIIPRNAQSCLDRSSKNSTASVPSTSIGAEDAKI